MAFSLKPSSNTVRASLRAHSGLGLFVVALLYLVCITGVASIYYPEFERWEQAHIQEYNPAQAKSFTGENAPVVQRALENLLAYRLQHHPDAKPFEDVWVGLPTEDMPRFTVGGHNHGENALELQFFVNADGSLGDKVDHEWTHFLVRLHYALTLPGVWGLTLVGIIGILLVGLIISGLLAHPNLFKNAFSLRVQRGQRQQQVDLHNRIGVWATPFMLAIAITGALIGLSQVLLFVFANSFFKGDTSRIANELYMPHPEPTQVAAPFMDTAPILQQFARQNPELQAYYFSIHYPETTAQTLEVGAYVPNRLVWYDAFQFNAQGEQIKRLGWPDGEVGMQIYASTYRLHFGHFGGLPVKILYTLFGLAMCFMCVTGMNIWFRRQQQAGSPRPVLERLWTAATWGFPTALVLTAISDFWWSELSVAIFWIGSALLLGASLAVQNRQQLSRLLRTSLVALIALLLILHQLHYGLDSWNQASALINSLWLLAAACIAAPLLFKWYKSTPHSEAKAQATANKLLEAD